jgi:signal transduction histidine kinase
MMAISPHEHPRIVAALTHPKSQNILVILSFLLIILFNSGLYFFRPYDGIEFEWGVDSSMHMRVFAVYPGGSAEASGIMAGDRILSIDGRPVGKLGSGPWYRPGLRPGDTVVFKLQRGYQVLTIPLTMGSYFDDPILLSKFVGLGFFSLCFWILGLLLCRFVPPHDIRARLVGLQWLLAGVAIAATGLGLISGFWGAYEIRKIIWWWLSFACIVAHLYFPAPSLIRHRKHIIQFLVVIVILFSVLDIVQGWIIEPRVLGRLVYARYGFFLLAVAASIGLLVRNYTLTRDPEIRRQTGIILWGTGMGLASYSALTLIPFLFLDQYNSGIHTFFLIAPTPLAYMYVIYQRKLLRVDLIINRVIAFFVLILLVWILAALATGVIAWALRLTPGLSLVVATLAAVLSLPALRLQGIVQRQVNRILYGSHYDFSSVTFHFSTRFAQAVDRGTLTHLLTQDLAQQMGIQEAALYLAEGDVLELQQPDGGAHPCSLGQELYSVFSKSQAPMRTLVLWDQLSPVIQSHWRYDWAQLFAPLVFKGQLQGVLILGSRSSGDVYGDQDIHIIAAIAHQAALAYANVQLVETLHGLARQLVRTDETQRKQFARDLHDTVLQELCFIKQDLLRSSSPTQAHQLDKAIQTLRQMIRSQRPPLLDHGLRLALQGLAEEMQQRAAPSPVISWRCTATDQLDLSDEQATALYRIAQESLANALKHARATSIIIGLDKAPDDTLRLSVVDDGIGMQALSHGAGAKEQHYGLAGMQERTAMINARLNIASVPHKGTSVTVELAHRV